MPASCTLSFRLNKTTLEYTQCKIPDFPEHFDRKQHQQLSTLVDLYFDISLDGSVPLRCTIVEEHSIDTRATRLTKILARRLSHHKDNVIKEMLDDMLQQGSQSSWSSPIVLAVKSDGSLRFCVDYSKLNYVTVKDAYLLTCINEALKKLENDLISCYWQFGMVPQSFSTLDAHYQFKVMPFRLCNHQLPFRDSWTVYCPACNSTYVWSTSKMW